MCLLSTRLIPFWMSVHDAVFRGSECNRWSNKFGGLDLGFFCSKPYSFIVLFRDARPALAVLRVLFSTCSSLNAHIHTDDQKRGAGDRKQVLYLVMSAWSWGLWTAAVFILQMRLSWQKNKIREAGSKEPPTTELWICRGSWRKDLERLEGPRVS